MPRQRIRESVKKGKEKYKKERERGREKKKNEQKKNSFFCGFIFLFLPFLFSGSLYSFPMNNGVSAERRDPRFSIIA